MSLQYYVRMPSLFLSEVQQCFVCTGFPQVASLFPSRICSWAVYKKQSLRILPWSCMLHSTAERQVKCHVWKICSSNFLFVKRLAGAISRSFFAERVDSCADDSVLAKTAHLCSRCLSVPNTAVKHRCLGWVISVPLYTCPYQQSVWRRLWLTTQVATIL